MAISICSGKVFTLAVKREAEQGRILKSGRKVPQAKKTGPERSGPVLQLKKSD
ncbi:hypothetical protein AB6T85_20785 [Erwinia sp. ACCC 02193]|uniref:Uncharacterized protein n=1 Tax=Erwinia aeris TaxID=3239803 RepID=A0ABV4EDG9_9GAMM